MALCPWQYTWTTLWRLVTKDVQKVRATLHQRCTFSGKVRSREVSSEQDSLDSGLESWRYPREATLTPLEGENARAKLIETPATSDDEEEEEKSPVNHDQQTTFRRYVGKLPYITICWPHIIFIKLQSPSKVEETRMKPVPRSLNGPSGGVLWLRSLRGARPCPALQAGLVTPYRNGQYHPAWRNGGACSFTREPSARAS